MTIRFGQATTPGHPYPHLAMLGALALTDAEGLGVVGGHDMAGGAPTVAISPAALAEVLLRQASRVADAGSPWRVPAHDGKPLLGHTWHALTPREDPKGRHTIGDTARLIELIQSRQVTEVDRRLRRGLGVRAPIRTAPTRNRGRSTWDMTFGATGREIVGSRLVRGAEYVAGRSAVAIAAALRGDELEPGRTDVIQGWHGAHPVDVDAAVAWCSLWGLSMLPVRHYPGEDGGMVVTTGAAAGRHGAVLALPVRAELGTAGEWRQFLQSRAWAAVVRDAAAAESTLGVCRSPGQIFESRHLLGGWRQLVAVMQWDRHLEKAGPNVKKDTRGGRLVHPALTGIAAGA